MLRTAPGDIRKTFSAAAALAVAALTASCTGGSSGAAKQPSGPPTSASVSASPTVDPLVNGSAVDLPATAVIQVGGSSAPKTLHTSSGQPLQLTAAQSGDVSLTLAMQGAGSEAFSVEGPARTGGPVADDHVVIFLSDGTLIDTVQGNPCTATYDVLTQKKLSATFRCLTREGAAKVPVTVKLTAAA